MTDEVRIFDHDDFDTISTPQNLCSPTNSTSIEGEIIGVTSTKEYLSCINCQSKVDQIGASAIGRCSNCSTQVKINKCELIYTANVIVCSTDGKQHKARLYQNEVNYLTTNVPGVSIAEKLLNTASVKLTINKGVASIKH